MNLTVVVPFWNGHTTIGRLLNTLPSGLPVIVVDDHSDDALHLNGDRVIRPRRKGFFSGAVNAGLAACDTDVLVLNQDVWFTSDEWLPELLAMRDHYAMIGDGVLKHPAWPKGYVQGTFMFLRRDAIEAVGGLNATEYPLWGATCEWQLRACRRGYEAHVSHVWRKWFGHTGRHQPGGAKQHGQQFGDSITQALGRWPDQRSLFLRTPPAISVIVPCFNYGHYLADAIHSLVGGPTCLGDMPGQTFQSFEVIIVDDASTDNSWEAALALADPWKGIRAIRLPKNRGTPGALNYGIRKAFGEFIHVLSADDMREPFALEVLYQAVRDNPRAVAYGDVRVLKRGERGRWLRLPEYNFDLVLHKNPMPAGSLYAKEGWRAAGGYPEAMVYGREDWAFNIALGLVGYCGKKIGESGNLYRREGQNRSLRTGNVHKGEEGEGFSWRQTFQRQLKALYPEAYKGERPMGCCGGRSKRRGDDGAPPARLAARPMAPEPEEDPLEGYVLLEYIGGNSANCAWWGPVTKTRYIFGGAKQVGRVHAVDVPGMLDTLIKHRKQFRRYKVPPSAATKRVAAAVKVPEKQAKLANPPQPDDLTKLSGVGPHRAQVLRESGFTTFIALQRTSPEELAKLAGFSLAVAERIVEAAKAYDA